MNDLAKIGALKEATPPIIAELLDLIDEESKPHAAIIRRLETAIRTGDPAEVRARFCSLEMWGGSGSVADLSLSRPETQKRSCELLSQLNAMLRDAGVECARADQWTRTFDSWLDQGVFDKTQ